MIECVCVCVCVCVCYVCLQGASSALAIQRHLVGRHKNYLYSNDLAAEAEREAHERVAALKEDAYLKEQAKATLKQMQIDRMHQALINALITH